GHSRINGSRPTGDAAHDLCGIGHLRHPVGAYETRDLDLPEAAIGQHVNEADLVGDRDDPRLILQAVARPDFIHLNEISHALPPPGGSSVSSTAPSST